jgi:hypothetical protein
MLDLEIRLQGEKFMAKQMCDFLPNKTNEQIRDKRKEKTYKLQVQQILSQSRLAIVTSEAGEQTGNGTLEVGGTSSAHPQYSRARRVHVRQGYCDT